MYRNGEGVPQDLVQAYKWFDVAVAQGVEMARTGRDRAAKQMTTEQIGEAQRLVRDLRPKAE